MTNELIAQIINFRLSFVSKPTKTYKEVIRGMDLDIYKGEVLGIVGESGVGKSVLALAMQGILPECTKVNFGQISLEGVNVAQWTKKEWNKFRFRGTIISSVPQNPDEALNPIRTIASQFIETLLMNNKVTNKKEAIVIMKKYLKMTQIINPDQIINKYPHQLTKSIIQRIVIAMALSTEAKIIIMDEPTKNLDSITQAKIINLILTIKKTLGTSFIFISHDISLISSVADKIAVMYAGRILEYGRTKDIVWNPKHPYTWNLLMQIPELYKDKSLFEIPSAVPHDSTGIKNEVFAPRNNYALGIDFSEESPKVEISKHHYVYSNLYVDDAPKLTPPFLIRKRWMKFKGGI